MEHFVTKNLANAFLNKQTNKETKKQTNKQLRNMLRKKMNIAADKYPRTNTVKTLHESFFSFKNMS